MKNKVDKVLKQRIRVFNAMYLMKHDDVVFMLRCALENLIIRFHDDIGTIKDICIDFLNDVSRIDYNKGDFLYYENKQ